MEASPREIAGERLTEKVENGGNEVDVLDDVSESSSSRGAFRPLHQERNVELLLVQGLSMPPPAVLFELFPMVRYEDDERVLIEPLLSQIVEESSQLAVHVANLLVVELEELFAGPSVGRDLARLERLHEIRAPEGLPPSGSERVRIMGVGRVEIEKERLLSLLPEPDEGAIDEDLRARVAEPLVLVEEKLVRLEPLGEPELGRHVGVGPAVR